MEGYELTEAQIETNIAFYDFADLAFVFPPFLSVFYVSFLVLIVPLIRKGLTLFNAFGRIAFTFYIGQSVILVILVMFIEYGNVVYYSVATIICLLVFLLMFNPNGKVVYYAVATITYLLVVVAQIIASTLWLKYFKYGPLKWIWRCGTYGKWLPILK